MAKRMILMLGVALLLIAGLGFVKFRQVKAMVAVYAADQPPPEAVTTIVAARRAVAEHDERHRHGRRRSSGVTVSADLPGIVERIAVRFRAGGAAGRRARRARYAPGTRAARRRRGRARPRAAEPRAHCRTWSGEGVVSQAEYDRAAAEHKQAEARVGEIRATIERKTIRAPFSGVLGIRQVNLGQYLAGGDADRRRCSRSTPIYVNFGVPQQDVAARCASAGRSGSTSDDAPASGVRRAHHARSIRSSTRRRATSRSRPRFANPGGTAACRACSCETQRGRRRRRPVVALPASAISYAPYGDSVFVVADMKTANGRAYRGVRQQFVKLGGAARRPGRRRLPASSAGEEVVTSGVFKLRNGAAVQVNNTVQPGNSPAPQPGGQLMKFTDLFIRRPVLAIVVNLVILIAGLQSIRALSVRQYPRSDIAVVTVTTAYVGANADLVRGFITTPLERVIASADGIDYMESSSAQGLSTITVHLKLNYDTNAALTQIQAKVAQVRNDLPPEAEAPVIELETADNQFAAHLPRLLVDGPGPEPDHRLPDARRAAEAERRSSGVQRADILGDRTFAMRVWLKPDRMAALGISPSERARRAGAQQLPVGARQDQGLDGVGEPRRQHRPAHAGGVPPARRQGGQRRRRPARRDRRRRARRRELRRGRPLQRPDRDVHGRLGAADREHPRGRSARCARRCRADPGAAPGGHDGRHPLRLDGVHPRRDRRGALDTLTRDAAHRHRRHLPLPRLGAVGPHSRRRDPDLARRRGVPDARRRLHDQPADAARDRALGRPRRRRRHRRSSRTSSGTCTRASVRCTAALEAARELVGPDHRDDDHARRGLRADRASRAA